MTQSLACTSFSYFIIGRKDKVSLIIMEWLNLDIVTDVVFIQWRHAECEQLEVFHILHFVNQ